MDKPLDVIANRLLASGRITPQDVMALRPLIWRDGAVARAEVELIVRLNTTCYGTCPEWGAFFVEAVTAHLVEGGEAPGYVNDDEAAWLIGQVDRDGRVDLLSELMLLVAVLEQAENVPDPLKAYVIAQVERIVTTGIGPTRLGTSVRRGTIDDAEVALLRRVFSAPGGERGAGVSDAEAQALFRIKAATANGNNASSWERLFVQLIGHYLMVDPREAPPSAVRAAELERFMDDAAPNIGRFLARMEQAVRAPQAIIEALTPAPAPAVEAGPTMTATEARWLKLAIAADHELDSIEKALLAFIIDESGPLPDDLGDWVEAKRA